MITTTNSVHRLKMSNSDTSKSDAKSEKGFTQVKHQLHILKRRADRNKAPKTEIQNLNCGLT